jgi:RNA polymerase sigma-70 factor (ECF subfamily)
MSGAVEHSDIERLFEQGRAAWPALQLERNAFDRRVSELASRGEPRVDHAADLYLACACTEGVRGAIDAFETSFAKGILRAIEQVDRAPEFVEEASQILRIKLFAIAPPKIAAYGARAKLSTWLTTAALRTALNLRASRGGRSHEEIDEHPLAAAALAERDFVRERYRADVARAVEAAIQGLTTRERSLLRLHLGERMSIDRLAVAYGVDRSTAARWVAAARRKLVDGARAEIEARLGVSPSELVEVGADVRSALEVSVIRLLGSARV